jgi:hypothetical protein
MHTVGLGGADATPSSSWSVILSSSWPAPLPPDVSGTRELRPRLRGWPSKRGLDAFYHFTSHDFARAAPPVRRCAARSPPPWSCFIFFLHLPVTRSPRHPSKFRKKLLCTSKHDLVFSTLLNSIQEIHVPPNNRIGIVLISKTNLIWYWTQFNTKAFKISTSKRSLKLIIGAISIDKIYICI